MFNKTIKMPELKDDFPLLLETIKFNVRHDNYEHVKCLAEKYLTFATGYNIEDQLERYFGRETEDQFKVRKKITIVNTADILNSCVQPMYKVLRTPATKEMSWGDNKEEKTHEEAERKIEALAKNFFGENDVEFYLQKRLPDLDKIDPNSFIVVEFAGKKTTTENTIPQPYPFEVNSKEAINYFYRNGILQWLFVRNESTMLDKDGKPTASEIIYAYMFNHNVKATQIHADTVNEWKTANSNYVAISEVQDFNALQEDTLYLYQTDEKSDAARFYVLQVFNHKFGFVPAKMVGTKTDPITRDTTTVPLIHSACCYLDDSIQTMSEFSITKRMHAFPQKYQYLPKCEGTPEKSCYKGKVPGGDTDCEVCKGTGVAVHTSSADIIGIRMPDDMKDIVNLDFISTYKSPPIDLVKFQKEFGFDELKKYAVAAVYNGTSAKQTQVVKTATEAQLDYESTYDALKPFANQYSSFYEFFYKCFATLADYGKGFVYTHKFPNDFNMESIEYLIALLKEIATSQSSAHIRKAVQQKIYRKIYIDEPETLKKIEIQDKFFPFNGKSETEIQFIIANNLCTDYSRVLYSNFDFIFQKIESVYADKQINFYEMTDLLQRAEVETQVNELIKEVQSSDFAASQSAFNSGSGTGVNG